jgi:hypothetical protein
MSSPVAATRQRSRAPRRWTSRPQLEREAGLSATAIARQVIEEASLWLGLPLSSRYAAGLAFRAHRCYAHSPSFRVKVRRPGERGRDLLYSFMRHWLAARFHAERPELFARLPRSFASGEPLPERVPAPSADFGGLSVEARLLFAL